MRGDVGRTFVDHQVVEDVDVTGTAKPKAREVLRITRPTHRVEPGLVCGSLKLNGVVGAEGRQRAVGMSLSGDHHRRTPQRRERRDGTPLDPFEHRIPHTSYSS